MEGKNEIEKGDEGNEKKEKEEIDQKLFSNYSKDFSVLLKEKDKQVELLNSYYELDKYNLDNVKLTIDNLMDSNLENTSKDIKLFSNLINISI